MLQLARDRTMPNLPMDSEVLWTTLLMLAAIGLTIGVCLPDVLYLLGLVRVRRGILGGPEEIRSGRETWLTEDISEQLNVLGFEPAGLYWERMPAHKTFREAIFVSRHEDCFAAVYRLFNNDVPRVA